MEDISIHLARYSNPFGIEVLIKVCRGWRSVILAKIRELAEKDYIYTDSFDEYLKVYAQWHYNGDVSYARYIEDRIIKYETGISDHINVDKCSYEINYRVCKANLERGLFNYLPEFSAKIHIQSNALPQPIGNLCTFLCEIVRSAREDLIERYWPDILKQPINKILDAAKDSTLRVHYSLKNSLIKKNIIVRKVGDRFAARIPAVSEGFCVFTEEGNLLGLCSAIYNNRSPLKPPTDEERTNFNTVYKQMHTNPLVFEDPPDSWSKDYSVSCIRSKRFDLCKDKGYGLTQYRIIIYEQNDEEILQFFLDNHVGISINNNLPLNLVKYCCLYGDPDRLPKLPLGIKIHYMDKSDIKDCTKTACMLLNDNVAFKAFINSVEIDYERLTEDLLGDGYHDKVIDLIKEGKVQKRWIKQYFVDEDIYDMFRLVRALYK